MSTYYTQDPNQVNFAIINVGPAGDVKIPVEYSKFRYLFDKPTDKRAQPKHKPWDLKIPLNSDKLLSA